MRRLLRRRDNVMILKYGSYAHDEGEVGFTVDRTPVDGAQGKLAGYDERWTIFGQLQAATQSALTTAIEALEAAYAEHGKDLILYLSDGTTETAHHLKQENSRPPGVRVASGPSYPDGAGAQYSTFRDYQITVEATIFQGPWTLDAADSPANLGSYTEVVQITGNGGPRFTVRQGLIRPQMQLLAQSTPIVGSQTGQAVGRFAFPPPNPPSIPGVHQDQLSPSREFSRGEDGKPVYTTSWSYTGSWVRGTTNPVPRVR